jgi:hypothetical protein
MHYLMLSREIPTPRGHGWVALGGIRMPRVDTHLIFKAKGKDLVIGAWLRLNHQFGPY